MSQRTSSNALSVNSVLSERYGSAEEFVATFRDVVQESPEMILPPSLAKGVEERKVSLLRACVNAPTPTFGEIGVSYGKNIAKAVVVLHISALNEYIGINSKMNGYQIETTASLIVREYHYLKISELLAFFYKCRLGYYKFFGGVDPSVLLSHLRDFIINERNEILFEEEKARELERARKERDNAITFEEYLRNKETNENVQ